MPSLQPLHPWLWLSSVAQVSLARTSQFDIQALAEDKLLRGAFLAGSGREILASSRGVRWNATCTKGSSPYINIWGSSQDAYIDFCFSLLRPIFNKFWFNVSTSILLLKALIYISPLRGVAYPACALCNLFMIYVRLWWRGCGKTFLCHGCVHLTHLCQAPPDEKICI